MAGSETRTGTGTEPDARDTATPEETAIQTKRQKSGATAPPPPDSDTIVLRTTSNNNENRFHRPVRTADGGWDSACPTTAESWRDQPRSVLGTFYSPCTFCYLDGDDNDDAEDD